MFVFRTDASIRIGSGHLMRCLTLAEELRNAGAEVEFITRAHEGNLNGLIEAKGFALCELPAAQQSESTVDSSSPYESWLGDTREQDAEDVIACLKGLKPDWLIADHYALDETWEKLVRPYVRNIMVIDDLADRQHDCDLLLDQNYTRGDLDRYADLVPPSCTKLFGPGYALLRREFAEARRDYKPKDGTVKRLFVFFGGSDPDNMTGLALRALSIPEFGDLEVDVVLGAGNPHRQEIERLAESRPGKRLHVQVDNIAELMASADLALCAGGSSTWERLCVGLPSLVVTIAENQVPFTRALHDDGFLRWIGPSQDVDEAAIQKALRDALRDNAQNGDASQRGFGLVDGVGGQRVAELITKGPDVASLTIREAEERDCALLWYWVNDPDVRNSAFNTDAVSWEDHRSWFSVKQRDSDSTIYIVESSVGPVGQVRFDRDGGHFRIDYSLGRQYRGKGIGRPMLTLAINAFQAKGREGDMVAEVKSSNIQSGRIFERMGFEEITHTHTPPGVRRFRLLFSPTETPG